MIPSRNVDDSWQESDAAPPAFGIVAVEGATFLEQFMESSGCSAFHNATSSSLVLPMLSRWKRHALAYTIQK